jgi:N-methylhydantoinase A
LDEGRTRERFQAAKGSIETVEQFAEGITRVADAHMEKALRKISVEYGYDPREFALLTFGGAGPLHACALAQALSIPKVVVPRMPGALSAYGIFVSDTVREYSRTVMLSPGDAGIASHFQELEKLSERDFESQRAPALTFRSVDLRYAGQGYEITVDATGDYVELFHGEHQRRYGYASRSRTVELVNVRVRAVVPSEAIPTAERERRNGNGKHAAICDKQIFVGGGWCKGAVYAREELRAGDSFCGPAVVAEYSATTFVPPRCRVEVDGFLNLVIDVPSN